MSDETEIIKYLKQGDERCMRMVFEAYYQALCVYALKYPVGFEDVEDIVQELLISFWENKRKKDFSGSVRAYLLGATQKACLNYLKTTGRYIIEDISDYSERLGQEFLQLNDEEAIIRRKKLKAALDRLPEKGREVFIAIVLEGLQYKEVAEKFGISVNTVKTQYARALKQLREYLDHVVWTLLFIALKKMK